MQRSQIILALDCVEGVRKARWNGETVQIYTEYPDGTAYINASKTFPPGTLAAAHRRWKIDTYSAYYGGFTGQWKTEYTSEPDVYSADLQGFMKECIDSMTEKTQHDLDDAIFGNPYLWRKKNGL